jgi:hypothetical protein
MKDNEVMTKNFVVKFVVSMMVLAPLQIATAPSFAAGTPGATANETNPLQEIAGASASQQRAVGKAANQTLGGNRTTPQGRAWAPKATVTCVRGQVTLNLTGKNAQCPNGFIKK